MASIAEYSAPRFEMGRVARRMFGAIGSNFGTFALLSLIPGVPLALLTWGQGALSEDAPPDLNTIVLLGCAGLVYLVGIFVFQAAVVHGTVVSLNERRATFGDCLSTGLGHLGALFLISVLYVLGIMAGIVLLIVPGLMVAIAWAVVAPVRVVERTGVRAAFGRSRELTRGHRWAIFGLFVMFGIVQFAITGVIGAFAGLNILASMTPEGAAAAAAGWPVIAASTIAGMINAVLGTAMIAATYYELRLIKEGIGPEALASVFD